MKKEIDTRFFRAGVGTVIYNSQGEVASFERAKFPVGVWQFQQGGIDLGEAVNTTLWRELKEEIGLTKDDFQAVTEYPQWTVYQDAVSVADSDKSRLGQAHRWFFLHLKDEVEIDLSKATDQETANYRWVSFQSAIDSTEELKKHVYQELEKYFVEHILTKQKTA
jgi:putative (di)nucleoside polyphosphate hydrolase